MLHQQSEPVIVHANLAEPAWVSDPIEVGPGLRRLSIDCNPGTWGLAKLEVTYALAEALDPVTGASLSKFRSFTEKIELTSATPSLVNRPLAGVRWVRVENTAADNAADRAAPVVVLVQ